MLIKGKQMLFLPNASRLPWQPQGRHLLCWKGPCVYLEVHNIFCLNWGICPGSNTCLVFVSPAPQHTESSNFIPSLVDIVGCLFNTYHFLLTSWGLFLFGQLFAPCPEAIVIGLNLSQSWASLFPPPETGPGDGIWVRPWQWEGNEHLP